MKNNTHAYVFVLAALLISGCGRDEITTYQVPKETETTPVIRQSQPAQSAAKVPVTKGYAADVPENWTERPGSGMRKVSYTIEGTAIDFYLISLTMGDVPSNVNRWRGQVGLEPASANEIAADVQQFQADGHPVNYIEIYNEEGGKGIIAAIVDLTPSYWYFTAKGPVDELKTHAGDIRKFLESVKIH